MSVELAYKSQTETKFPFMFISWTPVRVGPLPLELWQSKGASIITTAKKHGGTYVSYKLTDEEIAAVSAAYPPPKRQERFGRVVEQPVRQAGNFLKKNQAQSRKAF